MKKLFYIALFFSVQSFCVGAPSLKQLCLKAVVKKYQNKSSQLIFYQKVLEDAGGLREDHSCQVDWVTFLYFIKSP